MGNRFRIDDIYILGYDGGELSMQPMPDNQKVYIEKEEINKMTEGELALARHILEQVKEGKEFTMSKEDKVDLDSVTDYFNNLLLDIEKNKKGGKVKGHIITYQLSIVIGR